MMQIWRYDDQNNRSDSSSSNLSHWIAIVIVLIIVLPRWQYIYKLSLPRTPKYFYSACKVFFRDIHKELISPWLPPTVLSVYLVTCLLEIALQKKIYMTAVYNRITKTENPAEIDKPWLRCPTRAAILTRPLQHRITIYY